MSPHSCSPPWYTQGDDHTCQQCNVFYILLAVCAIGKESAKKDDFIDFVVLFLPYISPLVCSTLVHPRRWPHLPALQRLLYSACRLCIRLGECIVQIVLSSFSLMSPHSCIPSWYSMKQGNDHTCHRSNVFYILLAVCASGEESERMGANGRKCARGHLMYTLAILLHFRLF